LEHARPQYRPDDRTNRAEAALQASEEQLRMLVQGVTDYALYMLDTEGVIRTWNTGGERIKGYRADEVIGRPMDMFYPPEDVRAGKPRLELERAAAGGKYEEEGWRVRKDGTRFWAGVVLTALRDAHGKVSGFAKVTRDLTERRSAEERLRASEKRMRAMVESVKDYAIFMLDGRGVVQTWNTGARRIKGYAADEIIGSHFSRFYPEEELRARKPERELEIAARSGTYEEEGWRLRKDGTRFWASVLITAMHDETGALIGFVKVTRDLTERRESERVRSIVENVVDGIVTIGDVGSIETFNPAAERIFGCAADEVLGRQAAMLFKLEGAAPPWTGDTHKSGEAQLYTGLRRDGAEFPAEVAVGEFQFLGKRAYTAVVRDITERRRNEEELHRLAHELQERNLELQRSNQELDDFAYIASHDLKEPLRGIHNYSRFLMEDYAEKLDDAGRAKLETLTRLAQRMEQLIDSLLEFSRLGRLDLAAREVDLDEALELALGALQVTLRHERVEVRAAGPLPRLRADRQRVAEVFQNLIANAVKYNDKPQKRVEVGCALRDGRPVLYVRDNGIGIAEKHHEAVFRIFKRLHAREKFGGGSGAGLTIVKKIVERHGGRIWIESQPGEGSTFFFTLEPQHP
jgi:PAS domain S-box-containing protein